MTGNKASLICWGRTVRAKWTNLRGQPWKLMLTVLTNPHCNVTYLISKFFTPFYKVNFLCWKSYVFPSQHLLVNFKPFRIMGSYTENGSKVEWGAGITGKMDICRLRALWTPTEWIYYLSSWTTLGTSRPTSDHLNEEREYCMLQGSWERVQCFWRKVHHCCPVWLRLGGTDHTACLYSASQNAIAQASFIQRWLGEWRCSEGRPAVGCPQTPP